MKSAFYAFAFMFLIAAKCDEHEPLLTSDAQTEPNRSMPSWTEDSSTSTQPCETGTYQCEGSRLQLCSSHGIFYDVVECGLAQLCNAAQGRCDVCTTNTSAECFDAYTRQRCMPDSPWPELEACVDETPYCIEHGQCAECRAASDCEPSYDLDDACVSLLCEKGVCSQKLIAEGTVVSADSPHDCKGVSQCDGKGKIQILFDSKDVPKAGENTCLIGKCIDGKPAYDKALKGVECSTGICDGAGACVAERCGDDVCSKSESTKSCPHDCGSNCGDDVCNGEETNKTCSKDCFCGDGRCDEDEDSTSCPTDCKGGGGT